MFERCMTANNQLTQVHMEKWRLSRRQRDTAREIDRATDRQTGRVGEINGFRGCYRNPKMPVQLTDVYQILSSSAEYDSIYCLT